MVATHGAAMECFRRAHLPDQNAHGYQLCLSHANKLVRSFAALSEALDRHRGKGQQVVRVEHVTVQAGGQAIVGAVTPGGGGWGEERGTMPCTAAACPCTGARAAGPGRGAAARAGRRR